MLGSIISGVVNLGSTIYGGIKSGQYNRKALAEAAERRKANQRWYDIKSGQDYTQRSEIQNVLRKQQELMDERFKRSKASNVVAGGTDEALALEKQANAEAMGETMADIASNASSYKDSVEQAYRQGEEQASREAQNQYTQMANQVANAATQAIQTTGNLAQGITDFTEQKRVDKEQRLQDKGNIYKSPSVPLK